MARASRAEAAGLASDPEVMAQECGFTDGHIRATWEDFMCSRVVLPVAERGIESPRPDEGTRRGHFATLLVE